MKSSTEYPTMIFYDQLQSITSVLKRLSANFGPSRWDDSLLENLVYYS